MSRNSALSLVAISVAGSLILAGWGSADTGAHAPGTHATTPIAAVVMTKAELRAEARKLREPFWWAGAEKGYKYEFRRTSRDDVYVRYLPNGVKAGAPGAKYLIVATYPYKGAFSALKKLVHTGNDSAGPAGSIFSVDPNYPTTVYMAFRGIDYMIEIYDPKPVIALAIAVSGRVAPVTG